MTGGQVHLNVVLSIMATGEYFSLCSIISIF